MAIQFAESFDIYGSDESLVSFWNTSSTGWALTTTNPRTGDRCMYFRREISGGAWTIHRVLPSPVLSGGVAFGAYMITSLPVANNNVRFRIIDSSNTTAILWVAIQADGSIAIYKTGNVLLAQSGPILTANTWYHIEFKYNIDDTIGYCEVRVNGETVAQINNADLGTTPAGIFQIYNYWDSNIDIRVDDVIAWDTTGPVNNDFIGQARVLTVFPASDTPVADFVVTGAASGYQAIDEVPPDDDTSYIEGVNAGDISEFGMPALPPEVVSIVGLFIPSRSKLSAAGAATLQISMVSNGQVAPGVDRGLGVGWTYYTDKFETNPDGGGAWSKSAFEAALIRLEKTS